MIKLYVANLRKYNEGELVGEWVELPLDQEELEEIIEKISGGVDELLLADCECEELSNLTIGEYDNLYKLNELADDLSALYDYECEIVDALLWDGYDLEEALDIYQDCQVYDDCRDMTDVAYEVVEQCGYLDGVPDTLKWYFDYESFGRDLRLEGHFISTDTGYIEVCR